MAELTTVRVGLVLEADTDDAEEMDELTRRLRGEISQLDVSEVSSVEREAPVGTKAGPVAEVGAFLVTLVQTAGGMRAVIGTAQAWLSHHPDRTVEMELTVIGSRSPEPRLRHRTG